MAEYAKDSKVNKVLDYMDVLSVGVQKRIDQESVFKKWIFKIEFERLSKYESDVFTRFKKHFIITEQDRNQIPHVSNQQIKVVSNGVDLDYFKPSKNEVEKKYDVVFSGNMGYPPNITCAEILCKQIMPIVWKSKPNAKVVIVGTSPSKSVLDLASETVTITGRVEDIRTYFYQSKIFVGPLFMNTGLQNKLLESMALMIPCITSTLANNALKGKSEHDILIADTVQDFATKILELLDNDAERISLAKNSFAFVNQHHHWKKIVEQLSKELENIE
jgi:glycosyltransferase involved in cell wall biosynthesis